VIKAVRKAEFEVSRRSGIKFLEIAIPLRPDTDLARQTAATPDNWLRDTIEAGLDQCDYRGSESVGCSADCIGCDAVVRIIVASTVEHTGPGRSKPLANPGDWPVRS
jgi:hypothetical protein